MDIKITTFQQSEKEIRWLRDKVFGGEQGVPRDIDWDGEDPHCVQVLALDDDQTPVGTGRLRPDGKIGRLAVLANYRGKGIGADMLQALIHSARKNDLPQVYLHAQHQAISFYRRFDFHEEGAEFIEADIRHVKMIRSLR